MTSAKCLTLLDSYEEVVQPARRQNTRATHFGFREPREGHAMKELSTKVERLAELEQAITEINEAPVKVQTELATSILGKFPERYVLL